MTQEDKELLLQDLCARLPYGVKVQVADYRTPVELSHINTKNGNGRKPYCFVFAFGPERVKPYLRPMSSMTEEEKEELLISILGNKEDTKYFQVMSDGSIDQKDNAVQELSNFTFHWINFDGKNTSSYIDWLNANHFDYRGLIPKGLAIEVTDKNNPYKE